MHPARMFEAGALERLAYGLLSCITGVTGGRVVATPSMILTGRPAKGAVLD